MINDLIYSLTSNSLQSTEELFKAASYFDIPSKDLSKDPKYLKQIFGVRNEIAHEMDIDFSQRNRNRRPRRLEQMKQYTIEILDVAQKFLYNVDNKLK